MLVFGLGLGLGSVLETRLEAFAHGGAKARVEAIVPEEKVSVRAPHGGLSLEFGTRAGSGSGIAARV